MRLSASAELVLDLSGAGLGKGGRTFGFCKYFEDIILKEQNNTTGQRTQRAHIMTQNIGRITGAARLTDTGRKRQTLCFASCEALQHSL